MTYDQARRFAQWQDGLTVDILEQSIPAIADIWPAGTAATTGPLCTRSRFRSWTLRILGPYERGRLRVGDKNRREFLNVWGKYRQRKIFQRLKHVVPPQGGDTHCSFWILRKVQRRSCAPLCCAGSALGAARGFRPATPSIPVPVISRPASRRAATASTRARGLLQYPRHGLPLRDHHPRPRGPPRRRPRLADRRYCFREQLFITMLSRLTYDARREWSEERADVEYVRILHLAAATMEATVDPPKADCWRPASPSIMPRCGI